MKNSIFIVYLGIIEDLSFLILVVYKDKLSKLFKIGE